MNPPPNSSPWEGDAGIFKKVAELAQADNPKHLTKNLRREFNQEWGDRREHVRACEEEGRPVDDPEWRKRYLGKLAKEIRSGVRNIRRLSTELSHILGGSGDVGDFASFVQTALWVWAEETQWSRLKRELNQTQKAILRLVAISEKSLIGMTQKKRRAGRPNINLQDFWNDNFRIFVIRLLRHVRAAGGHLTLDKNTKTGTLIDALNLLRPHLPSGTIPNALSMSILLRLTKLDKKISILCPSDQ